MYTSTVSSYHLPGKPDHADAPQLAFSDCQPEVAIANDYPIPVRNDSEGLQSANYGFTHPKESSSQYRYQSVTSDFHDGLNPTRKRHHGRLQVLGLCLLVLAVGLGAGIGIGYAVGDKHAASSVYVGPERSVE